MAVTKCTSATSPFRCKYETDINGNPVYRCVGMEIFYPQCPKINVSGQCVPWAGAYVSAITVCLQRLWG